MHSMLLNSATIRFEMVPSTPFLIKNGDKGANLLHPERPDMCALRTRNASGEETVFVPGASIKGVVRSSAERILRSLVHAKPQFGACDPTDPQGPCQRTASSRGNDLRRESKGGDPLLMGPVHAMLCPACRMFGSQAIASRVRFADALPTDATWRMANLTEERQGVAIDRRTGGPSRGKLYGSEIVVGGRYAAVITLENFEMWQLALIGQVLLDVTEGLTRFGSAKSRGLGVFGLEAMGLELRQQRGHTAPAGIAALAAFLQSPYDLAGDGPSDVLDGLPCPGQHQRRLLMESWQWQGDDVWTVFDHAANSPWAAFVGYLDRKGA